MTSEEIDEQLIEWMIRCEQQRQQIEHRQETKIFHKRMIDQRKTSKKQKTNDIADQTDRPETESSSNTNDGRIVTFPFAKATLVSTDEIHPPPPPPPPPRSGIVVCSSIE